MTVLLRLAVLVLLVYCVQSAIPKTRQEQSQPDTKKPNEQHVKSQTQVKTKKTDASKSIKIQAKRNDIQSEKRISNSSSKKPSQNAAPAKHEDKRIQNAKTSAAHSKKASPSSQKVKPKTKVAKKKPFVVKEFPLDEIIFKGRATNEANAFIKANDKVGKALELIYEHAREQDLNELEDQIRRRMTAYKR